MTIEYVPNTEVVSCYRRCDFLGWQQNVSRYGSRQIQILNDPWMKTTAANNQYFETESVLYQSFSCILAVIRIVHIFPLTFFNVIFSLNFFWSRKKICVFEIFLIHFGDTSEKAYRKEIILVLFFLNN